jgi:hypothetical protein
MALQNYCRRLRIWETNYGRDSGWIIEHQGKPIAVLTQPRTEEMFWDSYQMEITTNDPALRQQMLTKEFWARAEAEGLVWRNREFGDVASPAFPALSPFPEPGRLTMRGLYISIGYPWPWDWVVLWLRRRFRRAQSQSN